MHDVPLFGCVGARQKLCPPFIHPRHILNWIGNLEHNTPHLYEIRDNHYSQSPTRDNRRDPDPSRHRFRLRVPPIVRSRVQIMGSIVPATPLPHRPLYLEAHGQMA